MKAVPLSLGAGLALLLTSLAGCKTTTGPEFDPYNRPTGDSSLVADLSRTNQVDPALLRPPTNLFTLGPGDRLEIELIGDPETRTTSFVTMDGKLYFHLLPGIDVWGLTLAETRDKMQNEMLNFVRDSPRVALSLRQVESQRIWLLGRVNAPGVYPMNGPMTLLEAIALARGPAPVGGGTAVASTTAQAGSSGAPEEAADLRRSFVLRQGQLLPVNFHRLLKDGDMSQNIYLQPDDLVYMPSAASRNVYVLGAVAQPRAVPLSQPTTLIAAIASAGGTIKDAYLSHVAVVRGSLSQPEIAVIDYKDVIRGRVPNVMLEPGDIVYVPFTPYQILTRYLDMVLDTFVRTVGANEGARLIDPNASPVDVSVGIGGNSGNGGGGGR